MRRYHHLGIPTTIAGKEILIAPDSPSPGVTVAFVVDNGAPIEFLCFSSACQGKRGKPGE